MPEDNSRKSLIPRPSDELEKVRPGPRDILTRMVSDALVLAKSQETALVDARFKLGGYEFRDPDYRQILLWAKALKLNAAWMKSHVASE